MALIFQQKSVRQPGRRRSRNAGFTLIEILCVLAIMGLIAGAIAVNVRALLPNLGDKGLTKKFETAVREVRRAALDAGQTFRLDYDEVEERFVYRALGTPPPETALAAAGVTAAQASKAPKTNTVRFLKQSINSQQYLLGGQLRSLEPATVVLFYPDGTCTPFTAEIIEGDSRRELRIDPWTTAEITSTEGGAR